MDQKERLAKAAAILMGVLLIASIVVFLVLIVVRSPFDSKETEPIEEIVVTDAPVELGTLDIAIPAGGKVVSLEATRFEILVLIDTPKGQQGLVIDRNSGTVLARLRFNPETP